jgi:biotin carboxyl carrier protein
MTTWLYNDQELALPALGPDSTARLLPSGDIEVQHAGRSTVVPAARDTQGRVWLSWQGRSFVLTPATPGRRQRAVKKSGSLTAPMTGVVSAVLVQVGDTVEAYQPLAIVEAMKVLATLEAPFAGTVSAVHVAKNDRVEHGMVLVELA